MKPGARCYATVYSKKGTGTTSDGRYVGIGVINGESVILVAIKENNVYVIKSFPLDQVFFPAEERGSNRAV